MAPRSPPPSPEDVPLGGLAEAAEILFGPRGASLLRGGAFQRELKRAFKRRALETHPDRARTVGRSEEALATEFRQVVAAYRLLLELPVLPAPAGKRRAAAPARPRGRTPATPPARSAPRDPVRPAKPTPPPARERDRTEKGREGSRPPLGSIPDRRLRLGEWLYYSGRIPFEALIEALAWQRSERPRIGKLAVTCGFLRASDVNEVLARRRCANALDVPFAEYATRIGLLTPFAQLALLAQQGRYRRRLGGFFVERGWLDADELDAACAAMWRHNGRFPEP